MDGSWNPEIDEDEEAIEDDDEYESPEPSPEPSDAEDLANSQDPDLFSPLKAMKAPGLEKLGINPECLVFNYTDYEQVCNMYML